MRGVLFAGCCLALAAAPADRPPEEFVRQALAALAAGDADAADALFAAAEERAADPGLVAFNRAVGHATAGRWREAEAGFRRALDDADAPDVRRAKALYNRGVCFLQVGNNAADFRAAADCFSDCLATSPADALAADARHNLEVAKVKWAKARATEKAPPKANDQATRTNPEPRREPPKPKAGTDPGSGDPAGKHGQKAEPAGGKVQPEKRPTETADKAAGKGGLPVVVDAADPSPLAADDARLLLKAVSARLDKDRKANARLLGGPERPHVRDW